jgi:hypothetical protein
MKIKGVTVNLSLTQFRQGVGSPQNGTSPRLDVKGHAAARPQRDTCDRVRPMPGDRIETKGVNQNCQNDSRLR